MTRQIYLNDTYLFTLEALILHYGEDEKGHFVILDQTIFYPQGGGQPSDVGLIHSDHFKMNVTLVRQVEGEIRHYIRLLSGQVQKNSAAYCSLDKNRRLLNSKYHTAAHLLSGAAEKAYPLLKAVKGHSFPKEAYVEFQASSLISALEIQSVINEAVAKNDKIWAFETSRQAFEEQFYKLPYSIAKNKDFRAVQIGDMPPIPCGGTHLTSTEEIGHIAIGKIKLKNGIMRLSYEVA